MERMTRISRAIRFICVIRVKKASLIAQSLHMSRTQINPKIFKSATHLKVRGALLLPFTLIYFVDFALSIFLNSFGGVFRQI